NFDLTGTQLSRRFQDLRTGKDSLLGTHLRLSENVAHLQIGLEYAVTFAEHIGVMNSLEARAHKEACLEALVQIATKQAGELLDERPAQVFVSAIQEGLANGDYWLADRNLDAKV